MSASQLKLAIFGASGAVGRAAVTTARAAGHSVRAIDRTGPDFGDDDDGIESMSADVLEDDLRAHVRGCDAVLSCLGVGNDPATLLDPPPLYTDGTSAICDAMEAEGVRRLIVISATFVDPRFDPPVWFKASAMQALRNVFDQMREMESLLARRENIDWTAIRPGWLMEGDPTDDYTVQAGVIPDDMLRTRHADAGAFMLKLAASYDWLRATPAIARHEASEHTNPGALLDEVTGG